MARPDLPPGLEGWQVVDATPQETSDGRTGQEHKIDDQINKRVGDRHVSVFGLQDFIAVVQPQ